MPGSVVPDQHRRTRGRSGHRFTPGRQAVLVLVYLRTNATVSQLVADFALGPATAWRYVHQVLDPQATKGHHALVQLFALVDPTGM